MTCPASCQFRGEEDRLRTVACQLVLAEDFQDFAEINKVGLDQLLIRHLRGPAGDNDIVHKRIWTVQVLEKILHHALELGVARMWTQEGQNVPPKCGIVWLYLGRWDTKTCPRQDGCPAALRKA